MGPPLLLLTRKRRIAAFLEDHFWKANDRFKAKKGSIFISNLFILNDMEKPVN
jgi:hypothetical protein